MFTDHPFLSPAELKFLSEPGKPPASSWAYPIFWGFLCSVFEEAKKDPSFETKVGDDHYKEIIHGYGDSLLEELEWNPDISIENAANMLKQEVLKAA
jgi:hypothetical protein